MGLILELLFEFVFQFLIEFVFELGLDGVSKVMSSRTGRLVASGVTGFFGGLVWGVILRSDGLTTTPKTVWVSLALAVTAAIAGYALRTAARERGDDPDLAFRGGLLPWRWSPHQWDALAILNVFVAAGVVAGFAGGA